MCVCDCVCVLWYIVYSIHERISLNLYAVSFDEVSLVNLVIVLFAFRCQLTCTGIYSIQHFLFLCSSI